MKYCVMDCFNIEHYFDNMIKATIKAYQLAMWCSHSDLCDAQTGEVLAIFDCDINNNINVTYC